MISVGSNRIMPLLSWLIPSWFWIWTLRCFFLINFFKLCERCNRWALEILFESWRLYNFNRRLLTRFRRWVELFGYSTDSFFVWWLLSNLGLWLASPFSVEVVHCGFLFQTYFAHYLLVFIFLFITFIIFVENRRVVSLFRKKRIEVIFLKGFLSLPKFWSLRSWFWYFLGCYLNWVVSIWSLGSITWLCESRTTL